ncbi:MAG: sulfite exporter TauE/SafE family protein [Pseudomonadota bacterium]
MDNLIYISAVFLLAGTVKGVTGMGLPTVAVALLSLTMAPMQAAALLVVPSLLTNLWQVLTGAPLYPVWSRFWPMMAGICAGTLAGGLFALRAEWAAGALGIALVTYAGAGLLALRWKVKQENAYWQSPLVGIVTGAIAVTTGVFVLPAVPYLQALELERDELVQAMGLAFTVSTLAIAVSLAAHDAWQPAVAGASFLMQVPALAGMLLGQKLRQRMPPALFRRCLLFMLMLLGMQLALRAAWS